MPNHYQRKRLPYGFSFLDVTETKKLKSMGLIAEKILEDNQYQPVKPAAIDFEETFQVFGREDMFHLKDHLGDRLALRNDVTVQIIKGFCNQFERKDIQDEVSRYYYNVPVFTDVRKNYSSLREVQQLGAEIIGANSEDAVFEMIQLSDQILNKAFSMSYKLILGDMRLVYFIREHFSNIELNDIFIKKDADYLITSMVEEGWEERNARLFYRSLLYYKEEQELDNSMRIIQRSLKKEKKDFIDRIRELLTPIFQLKKKLDKHGISIDIDPLLTRRPKYYTDFLFEGYASNLSFPPLRGGSYDKLISQYSHENFPASGFSLDMSSILR